MFESSVLEGACIWATRKIHFTLTDYKTRPQLLPFGSSYVSPSEVVTSNDCANDMLHVDIPFGLKVHHFNLVFGISL